MNRIPASRYPQRHPSRPARRRFLGGAAAVGVSITLPPELLKAAENGKVNFYNWDTYIGETTIEDFEKATGIEVQYDLFADNDELFAKLKGGNPGYDLIVPTNDFVERMIVADMLLPIDHSKIPNMANLDPVFLDPAFDPGRKFSLPYMWGTIGIGYRKSAVSEIPDSWKYLYDSDQYAGRIAMLSEPTTVLQMGLKYLGRSMNDWSEEGLAEVTDLIIRQKPNIASFAGDNGQDLLLAGEVDLAQEWSGDLLQAMEEDDDLDYVVPKEGALLWEDTLCIPKGAPNVDNAHTLINFLLDAEVGRQIAEYIYYASPNKAAVEIADKEYSENTTVFPTAETLANCEASIFPGQEWTRKIDEAWTRIKAS